MKGRRGDWGIRQVRDVGDSENTKLRRPRDESSAEGQLKTGQGVSPPLNFGHTIKR